MLTAATTRVESIAHDTRDLFNFQPPADGSVSVTPGLDGLLGLVDVVTAQKFGLPTAKLRPANAPGGTPVGPDARRARRRRRGDAADESRRDDDAGRTSRPAAARTRS